MARFVPYLVILWLPFVCFLIAHFQKRKGIFLALVVGTLFLPVVGQASNDKSGAESGVVGLGPIQFSKDFTISYALLLAVFLYDFPLLTSSRPGWVDLPMVVWCLVPMLSALTNEPPPDGSLAIRDGFMQMITQSSRWAIPYLVGRLYLTDAEAFRDFALGLVLWGLIYVPLCLVEVRMSPQIHAWVYGFSPVDFTSVQRFGGFRPQVFFNHGLTLSLWMVSVLLIAFWLTWTWSSGRDRKFTGNALFLLVPTTILMKSTGALALGLVGGFVLYLSKIVPARIWLVGLVLVSPLYATVRVTGAWRGEALIEWISENISHDRAESLDFRMHNEDMLITKALEKPFFGWGGWGRARVYDDETGLDLTITDGLWVICFGNNGLVGLLAVGGIVSLPTLLFAYRFSPRDWSKAALAPATACAVIVVLWGIDCLMNAMMNPIYLFMAGGLTSLQTMPLPEKGQIALGMTTNRLPTIVSRATRQTSELV
jgi:hypothetical protein